MLITNNIFPFIKCGDCRRAAKTGFDYGSRTLFFFQIPVQSEAKGITGNIGSSSRSTNNDGE